MKLGDQWIEDGRMYKAVRQIGALVERKDLGPVNEDGCLAEERTGLFPTITKVNDGIWKASVYQNEGLIQIEIEIWATTQQQVIDAYNRRA